MLLGEAGLGQLWQAFDTTTGESMTLTEEVHSHPDYRLLNLLKRIPNPKTRKPRSINPNPENLKTSSSGSVC